MYTEKYYRVILDLSVPAKHIKYRKLKAPLISRSKRRKKLYYLLQEDIITHHIQGFD